MKHDSIIINDSHMYVASIVDKILLKSGRGGPTSISYNAEHTGIRIQLHTS